MQPDVEKYKLLRPAKNFGTSRNIQDIQHQNQHLTGNLFQTKLAAGSCKEKITIKTVILQ